MEYHVKWSGWSSLSSSRRQFWGRKCAEPQWLPSWPRRREASNCFCLGLFVFRVITYIISCKYMDAGVADTLHSVPSNSSRAWGMKPRLDFTVRAGVELLSHCSAINVFHLFFFVGENGELCAMNKSQSNSHSTSRRRSENEWYLKRAATGRHVHSIQFNFERLQRFHDIT